MVSLAYLVYKLLFWNRFTVGMAPLVIGIFFFTSMQLISSALSASTSARFTPWCRTGRW